MIEIFLEIKENPQKLIGKLQKKFVSWKIIPMGNLKKYPGSRHFHVKSVDGGGGMLEITTSKNFDNKIIVKIAKNRDGYFARQALEQLGQYSQ